ncbi:SanA/YdcF family protein [Chryseobacterium paludis]|uniref:SanA/YdcF family protein n=1 Tax=Chryseobacterium paludis TaxID=2956784 RepID=UPI0036F2B82F
MFNLIISSIEIGILVICLANAWVFALTNGRTYTKISKIPPREIALVLGTSPKMRSGLSNPYFTKRMDAAALLYHHGKIRKIIVSGEKSKGYNEPAAMKNYLVYQEGVPEEIIIEDPKGFNTYKSILRCKDIYKENNVIIVSQGFHNLRALFFARNNNMNALGFDAQDVNKPESYYRNQFREIFARMIAVVYFLLGISPD